MVVFVFDTVLCPCPPPTLVTSNVGNEGTAVEIFHTQSGQSKGGTYKKLSSSVLLGPALAQMYNKTIQTTCHPVQGCQ